MAARALDDVRVIDISRSVSGAWCSRLLADFGAGVIIVEPPGGHPLRTSASDEAAALGAYVLANKQSMALDLETEPGRAELRALVAGADVLVSSARPSQLAALGLTYAELGQPSLIMAHLTPYGMTGAMAEAPGNDLTVAARSGWASINGDADREPLKPSGWQASYCAGAAAFAGVLAALHHRAGHPGEGQEVEVAELDVMVAMFAPALLRGQYLGEALGRKGAADITTGPVPVADGHFSLTISRSHFWRDAMNVLGLPDLAEDHRWDTGWYRQAHKDEYVGRVQEKMLQWNRKDLFEELAARRVVAGPVLTMDELATNEHLRARKYWARPGGEASEPEYPGAPFRMSETPWALRGGPPAVGEHSGEVPRVSRAEPGAYAIRPYGTAAAGSGPLSGLRGIVLTQAWAGAFCTELLGLLGADVIQVEVRKRLDSWRGSYDAPLAAALRDVPTAQHSWNANFLYNSVNLNKRCITLDLQTAEGVAVLRRLLPHADFVAENFSPRVLGNLGIGYDAMKAIRPDIILCSLSAYGHDGPWANVPGIGGTIEPTSGMSALLGYEDGPPENSGQMYPDPVAGIYGCAAILTALHYRNRTGRGQYIDLSMQEANLTHTGDAALQIMRTGRQRRRFGNRHPELAPHGVYACAGTEQWVAIACETEEQWQALCGVAGGMGWSSDPRFLDCALRKANEDALDAAIAGWTRAHSRDELVSVLVAAQVPVAPVLDGREVAVDGPLRSRGIVVDVGHREAGRWPQAACPVKFSRTRAETVRPAPLLGEHSLEVLAELLGMGQEEYDRLVAAGVSGMGPPA
jgi:crotonobetainyl-CoA:carnitine CoA-transferase CaiB-like acyl-CoA transferase